MTTRTWIRRLFARTPRTVPKAPARFRLRLEAIEDRWVPSPIVVDNPTDMPAVGHMKTARCR